MLSFHLKDIGQTLASEGGNMVITCRLIEAHAWLRQGGFESPARHTPTDLEIVLVTFVPLTILLLRLRSCEFQSSDGL